MGIEVPPTEFAIELTQGSVKAAIKDNKATTRDQLQVPIELIKIAPGMNVRIHDAEYESHIEAIAASIMENGFLPYMPLSGFASKEGDLTFIYCTGGFTRLMAAKRVKERGAVPLNTLPVVLQPQGTNMADMISRLDLDNKNRPLKPYEKAIIYKRLIAFGWTAEQIAAKHAVSEQFVNECLYLMGLPQALRGLVINGKVSALDAVRLAKKVGPAEALKAYEADLGVQSAAGDDAAASDPFATNGGQQTGAVARARNRTGPIIAKKTLFRAIDYTLALPSDGLKWLKRWRDGNADALAELEAYKPPRKNAKKDKETRGAGRAKKKDAETGKSKRGNAKNNAADDPFDISGGATASTEDVL